MEFAGLAVSAISICIYRSTFLTSRWYVGETCDTLILVYIIPVAVGTLIALFFLILLCVNLFSGPKDSPVDMDQEESHMLLPYTS